MAELLINLRNLGKDSWLPGDVVDIRPDGYKWGKEERPPKFVVVKIPGVDVDELRKLLEHETDDVRRGFLVSQPNATPDEVEEYVNQRSKHRPRVWRLMWEKTPQQIKDQIIVSGYITLNKTMWEALRRYIRNERSYREIGVEILADVDPKLGGG